jgi:hypothetical protein
MASTLKSKVVLDADRIETHGLFSTRSLKRKEIQGRRVAKTYEGWRTGDTWLIPRGEENGESAENKITISNKLKADSVLREWIDSLPDLDAPERRASMESTNKNEPDNQFSTKWALMFVLCVGIAGAFLVVSGKAGKGVAGTLCALAIGVAVSTTWGLRKNAWYWVTVGSIIALHLPLILLIPWPNVIVPGEIRLLSPIAAVDCLIEVGVISLVERFMSRRGKLGSEN